MSEKVLQKANWSSFVQALADARELWFPVKDGPIYKFAPYSGDVDAGLEEYAYSSVPPKAVVLPQTETMFLYQVGDKETSLPEEKKEKVVLGARPCDARAMDIVDRVFQWDEDDPYYLENRNKTAVIGLACNEPFVNCFCTSLDGSPGSTQGLDVLMVDLGDKYYLRSVTDKGSRILGDAESALEDASGEGSQAEEIIKEAEGKIKRSIDTEGIREKLEEGWEAPLWDEVSRACLGCGACTFLCPTCHCFDIQDEVEGFDGRRCRMWDSCMFGEYTLHTSGHNPRPSRKERTRNRISHKYRYYVEKFDKIACVGCGRCITSCPVNIDILDILSRVKEEL